MAGKDHMSVDINSEMVLKGLHRFSQFTYSVSILLVLVAFIINAIHGSHGEGSTTECTLDCHIFHSCLDSMGRQKKTDWNNQIWIPFLLVFLLGCSQFFRGQLLAKQKDEPIVDGSTVLGQWIVLFLTFFYTLNSLSRGANIETSSDNQLAVTIPTGSEFEGFTVVSTWTEQDSTGKSSEEQTAFGVLMAFLVVAIVTQILLRLGCFFKEYYRPMGNRNRASKAKGSESVLNYIGRNVPEIGYVVTSLIIIVLTWIYYEGVKDFKNNDWSATVFKHGKSDVTTTAEYYTAYVINGTEQSCNMTDAQGTVDYNVDEIFNRTNCSLGLLSNSPECSATDQDENESKAFKIYALVGSIFELLHVASYVVVTAFGLCGMGSGWKKAAQFGISASVVVSLFMFLLSLYTIQKRVMSESCQSSCYLNPTANDNKKCDENVRILVAISSLILTRMAYEILNFDSELGANRPSNILGNPFENEGTAKMARKRNEIADQSQIALQNLAA